MSTDAFAAAIGKGLALHKPGWPEALRTGLIFGVIEAITPVIGWLLGRAAGRYVSQWDHWIAFVLLGVLGLRMIRNGLAPADADEPVAKPTRHLSIVVEPSLGDVRDRPTPAIERRCLATPDRAVTDILVLWVVDQRDGAFRKAQSLVTSRSAGMVAMASPRMLLA